MENSADNISTEQRPFSAWVDYVFNHPITNPAWHFTNIEEDNWEPPKEVAVEYMSCLFKNTKDILTSFSDAQVNQGLRYLVSPSCSNHMFALFEKSVSWEKRKEAIAAIYFLFEGYFAKHCTAVLSYQEKAAPLDNTCFMWWDDFPWHGRPKETQYAELDGAVLSVIEKILLIPHDACRKSALHGLGHWWLNYPQRASQAIDLFLSSNPNLRPELKQYALQARAGRVQ